MQPGLDISASWTKQNYRSASRISDDCCTGDFSQADSADANSDLYGKIGKPIITRHSQEMKHCEVD